MSSVYFNSGKSIIKIIHSMSHCLSCVATLIFIINCSYPLTLGAAMSGLDKMKGSKMRHCPDLATRQYTESQSGMEQEEELLHSLLNLEWAG